MKTVVSNDNGKIDRVGVFRKHRSNESLNTYNVKAVDVHIVKMTKTKIKVLI